MGRRFPDHTGTPPSTAIQGLHDRHDHRFMRQPLASVEPDDPRIGLVHLDCLISDDPGLADAIAIAQEHGVADLGDDGGWVVGESSVTQPTRSCLTSPNPGFLR
jgi:hypothetical protein